MQNGGSWRDRISAEEHRYASKLRSGDKTNRNRFSPRVLFRSPLFRRRGRYMMLLERAGNLRRFAIGMASIQGRDIGVGEHGVLREFGLQPVNDRLPVAIEHPERKAQRPHILAAERFLVAKTEFLDAVQRMLRDVEGKELPLRQAAVLQRIAVIFRLGKIALVELAQIGRAHV